MRASKKRTVRSMEAGCGTTETWVPAELRSPNNGAAFPASTRRRTGPWSRATCADLHGAVKRSKWQESRVASTRKSMLPGPAATAATSAKRKPLGEACQKLASPSKGTGGSSGPGHLSCRLQVREAEVQVAEGQALDGKLTQPSLRKTTPV